MLTTRYLIVFLLCKFASAFNFDTKYPIVYTDPFQFNGISLEKSSYFGYSVLLYPGATDKEPWIQIGAPRGGNYLQEYKTTGIVFRCGIKEPCYPLTMNTTSLGKSDEAFFGYNMDISSDNSIYATCGPRWMSIASDDYYTQGACFYGDINTNQSTLMTPLFQPSEQLTTLYGSGKKQITVYNKAHGQIGFAAQFTKEKMELVVGVPGLLNWKGAPALIQEESVPPASRRRRQVTTDTRLGKLVLPSGKLLTENKYFDLAGYSVTSGKFYGDDLYYVTGMPRANIKGAVLIFQFMGDNEGLTIKERKDGTKYGEYFGSSLTASDINGDELDDLIVGAPFAKSSDSKYDEGAIYIYIGTKSRLESASTSSISGKSNGGRFGETLMSLGDIDKDGFNDIAVAAPYENENSGVVYIFRGDKHAGLHKEPSQRIVGRDIVPNLRGFGISLSRPADIDGNQYNDLAIGAYKSGHAILLRAKPVVFLKHNFTSSASQINVKVKQSSFTITSCVTYFGMSIVPPIRIVRTISVDRDVPGRAYLEDSPNGIVTELQDDKGHCATYTVKMDLAANSNFYDPIVIKASVDLEKKTESKDLINVTNDVIGNDEFCSNCAILFPYNTGDREKQINVDFNRDCGDDNVCSSNLFISAKFVKFDNGVYIVGSESYITMETTVMNSGENAFQTAIQIVLPQPVRLRSIPSYCKEVSSQISCNIDNPLAPNAQKTIALELDFHEVNNGLYESDLNFSLNVSTSSDNIGEKGRKLSLKLVKNADVQLIGQSSEETYSYVNRSYGFAAFQQVFKVLKHDISPIQKVEFTVEIPMSFDVNNKNVTFLSVYAPEGTLSGQSITCSSTIEFQVDNIGMASDIDTMSKKKRRRRDLLVSQEPVELSKYPANRTIHLSCSDGAVTCGRIKCALGPFKNTKSYAEIKLKMKLNISELADYNIEKDIVIVTTAAAVKISDTVSHNNTYRHAVSVASVFIGASAGLSVAIWIIIIAVICGILLLLILAGVLYKLGFFKRTKKEMLMKEKAEQNAVGT